MTKRGDVVTGVVSDVVPIGIIVDCLGTRFLIAHHEYAWEQLENPECYYSLGDSVTFLVLRELKPDPDALNSASIRRAHSTPNPWKPKPPELLAKLDSVLEKTLSCDYNEVVEFVRSMDPEDVFHSLFELSTRGLGRESWMSAEILLTLNLACPLDCTELVRDIVMSSWNASLEQLPWYAGRHFGVEKTHGAISAIRQERMSIDQWENLDTIAYWVEKLPDKYRGC